MKHDQKKILCVILPFMALACQQYVFIQYDIQKTRTALERMLEFRANKKKPIISDIASVADADGDERSKVNPFLPLRVSDDQQIIYPHFGFMPAISQHEIDTDWFGFRNPHGIDIFKSPPEKLIVMTGNSELAGYTHEKSIAEILEHKLRENDLSYSVLNLAINSNTLANEIAFYVFLAQHHKPKFVIAHSTGVEYQFGMTNAWPHQELGLSYYPPWIQFAFRSHQLRRWDGDSLSIKSPNSSYEAVKNGTLFRIEHYNSLVEKFNGHFLLGIQKVGLENSLFPFYSSSEIIDLNESIIEFSIKKISTI